MALHPSIAAAEARWRASQARALNARSSMVGAPYVALGDAVQDASDAAYARERVLHQCGQSALEGLSWVALGVSLLVVAPLAYSRGKKAARA